MHSRLQIDDPATHSADLPHAELTCSLRLEREKSAADCSKSNRNEGTLCVLRSLVFLSPVQNAYVSSSLACTEFYKHCPRYVFQSI